MTDNHKAEVKEFNKCPQCGSLNRFFEQMGNELKAKDIAPADMQFYYEAKSGAKLNEAMIERLTIGTEFPVFALATDVCSDCGCIYAVKLKKGIAKKSLERALQMPAQKAQRMPPPFNNPRAS